NILVFDAGAREAATETKKVGGACVYKLGDFGGSVCIGAAPAFPPCANALEKPFGALRVRRPTATAAAPRPTRGVWTSRFSSCCTARSWVASTRRRRTSRRRSKFSET